MYRVDDLSEMIDNEGLEEFDPTPIEIEAFACQIIDDAQALESYCARNGSEVIGIGVYQNETLHPLYYLTTRTEGLTGEELRA